MIHDRRPAVGCHPRDGRFERISWDEALNDSSLNRAYGVAGMRASLPVWAVNPDIESTLFNVHGIAHKVVFETDISYAQLGAANNISGTEVTNQLAWARREFRRLAQERLRALCPSDDEYQREARALFGGNGGWGF
jgi:hypothetical protein